MGLGLILAALCFFSFGKHPNNDPEKANRQEASLDQDIDDNGSEDDGNADNHNEHNVSDTPSQSHGPQSSATANLSSAFPRSLSTLSDFADNSWLSKVKAYIFPSDENLDLFIPNYRWTPIISGVVIPFSILLEIPGLTDHWYIKTDGYQTVETRPNPVILDTGLAISMASAVIANICLVLRFLEKRVKTVTLLCIIFLTVHDAINVIAIITFGVEHRFNDDFTYGQSYWMTLCSTVVSTFTNCTLIVDYVRTPDFARSGSGLTRKQRSLVIIVIVLLTYIALGALFNMLIQGLSFIDGLYFTTVTIETIGFGDIVPESTGARIFVCCFSAIGVINLGVAVGMTRETVLEGLEVGYRRRVRSVQERRRAGRRFRRWESRWRKAVEWRLKEQGLPVWISNHVAGGRIVGAGYPHWAKRSFEALGFKNRESHPDFTRRRPHRKHLNIEALSPDQLEAAALEAGVPLQMFLEPTTSAPGQNDSRPLTTVWFNALHTPTHLQVGRMAAMMTRFAVAVTGRHINMRIELNGLQNMHMVQNGIEPQTSETAVTEPTHQRRGVLWALWARDQMEGSQDGGQDGSIFSYETLKEGLESEEKKANYAKLTVAWSLFLIFWFVGSAIFHATEHWPYGDAMYFCFMAFTTTGFGDFAPVTPAGRSVFVVWALLGVGTMTILISILQEASSSRYKNALHSTVFDRAVKTYQERMNKLAPFSMSNPSHVDLVVPGQTDMDESVPLEVGNLSALTVSQNEIQQMLEALPAEIIKQTQTFMNQMQYFIGANADELFLDKEGQVSVPHDLKQLLDDIAGSEGIGERVKTEILQDADARQKLCMLGIEHGLRNMLHSAEQTRQALAQRDNLIRTSGAGDQSESHI